MKFTIEGIRHVSEYLRYRPQVVAQVVCSPRYLAEIKKLAAGHKVAIDSDTATKQVKANISITPLHESELFTFVAKGKVGDTIVALDHIVDPRNLGAIARSAAFFGVRAIVIPRRRQVALTVAAINAAQGGFAFLDLFLVTNLSRALEKLKKHDFWLIGADMAGECLTNYSFTKKILVFGGEEKGLSTGIRSKCDCLFRIVGHSSRVPQSLNVSVAAAIFLHAQNSLTDK